MNKTIFQFFHWYYTAEGNLWKHCQDQAGRLAELGVTDTWLPPAYKSSKGTDEPGYAVYDLYDLGEFDQRGTVRTRYGTKQEYLDCINELHKQHISVLADIVLNHRDGGDERERFPVILVNEDDRKDYMSDKIETEGNTKFTFPGRQGKYSDFVWDWHSFTGICEDHQIGLIQNEYASEGWEQLIEDEKGNYDYLMCYDVEFRNPSVREELKRWGVWYVETTGIDGFRLDAIKHITPGFFPEWLEHLDKHFNKHFFCIGEYWRSDVNVLQQYIEATGGRIQLFDVPLHFNFHQASLQGGDYDMRAIFDNSLIKHRPELAISFVDNHDTQPLQSLQSPVEQWFKPIAYSLILLRQEGIPCVFYPTIFEAKYVDRTPDGEEVYVEINKNEMVERMMKVRKHLAYGQQWEYFDDAHLVGWTRQGDPERPGTGCAVLISNTDYGEKKMSMGAGNAGREMKDLTQCFGDSLVLDENGEGVFRVNPGSACVWIFADKMDLVS